MDNEYMYLFARKDLQISQQIIQTAHASAKIGEAYHGDTYAVLCGADNEEHLHTIAEHLDSHGIAFHMFWEPDLSEYTAIATAPLKGGARSPLRKFKLM